MTGVAHKNTPIDDSQFARQGQVLLPGRAVADKLEHRVGMAGGHPRDGADEDVLAFGGVQSSDTDYPQRRRPRPRPARRRPRVGQRIVEHPHLARRHAVHALEVFCGGVGGGHDIGAQPIDEPFAPAQQFDAPGRSMIVDVNRRTHRVVPRHAVWGTRQPAQHHHDVDRGKIAHQTIRFVAAKQPVEEPRIAPAGRAVTWPDVDGRVAVGIGQLDAPMGDQQDHLVAPPRQFLRQRQEMVGRREFTDGRADEDTVFRHEISANQPRGICGFRK